MDSVIVFGSESDRERIEEFANLLPEATSLSIVVTEGELGPFSYSATVFSGDQGLWNSLYAASQTNRKGTLTLINAASGLSAENMATASQAVLDSERKVGLFSVMHAGQELTAARLCAAELTAALVTPRPLPLAAMKVSGEFLRQMSAPEANSATGIMYSVLINAISEFETLDCDIECIRVEQLHEQGYQPSAAERALLLRQAVNQINIEELFPNRPWESLQNETAAACYQILAVQFITLGDLDSADECITLSEQLEDTPRSLALKGIIAMLKGEELEAVANMVSSLQEYERVKKENTLDVKPSAENLEVINSSLQSGLEALNARNNSRAASCFAEALFLFDNFFSETGLRMPQ